MRGNLQLLSIFLANYAESFRQSIEDFLEGDSNEPSPVSSGSKVSIAEANYYFNLIKDCLDATNVDYSGDMGWDFPEINPNFKNFRYLKVLELIETDTANSLYWFTILVGTILIYVCNSTTPYDTIRDIEAYTKISRLYKEQINEQQPEF